MNLKNVFKRTSAVALAGVMTAMGCLPAFAADPTPTPSATAHGGDVVSEYNDLVGNKVFNFKKYMVMRSDANVPQSVPTFTIAAAPATLGNGVVSNANPANGTPQILTATGSTVVTGSPAITAVTPGFQPGQTTYTSATHDEGGNSVTDNVVLGSDEKYAKVSVNVDFSGVTFKAPGIYRYVVTETTPTAIGVTIEDGNTRYLDVYVEDKSTVSNAGTAAENNIYDTTSNKGDLKALEITNYVFHRTDAIAKTNNNASGDPYYVDDTSTDPTGEGTAAAEGFKTDGFTNRYNSQNLTIEKHVTGNQGDRTKLFPFTVVIGGSLTGTDGTYSVTVDDPKTANPGTIYDIAYVNITTGATISASDADGKPARVTADSTGATAAFTIQLRNEERAIIKGLATGTTYQIIEGDVFKEGYQVSAMKTAKPESADDPSLLSDATNPVAVTFGNKTVDGVSTTDNKTTGAIVSQATLDAHSAAQKAGNIAVTKIKPEYDQKVAYTNQRQGTVPTGVLMNIAPYALIVGAAVLLIFGKVFTARRSMNF